MQITNKLLRYINYWLVPVNATDKERLTRIFEVGMCIGMIMTFFGYVITITIHAIRALS